LVFGRITGWGQDGPLRRPPGTTILYRADRRAARDRKGRGADPPLISSGISAAGDVRRVRAGLRAWQAQSSGKGQVVDAAMTDGASLLMA